MPNPIEPIHITGTGTISTTPTTHVNSIYGSYTDISSLTKFRKKLFKNDGMINDKFMLFLKGEGYTDIYLIKNKGICGILKEIGSYVLVTGLDYYGYEENFRYKSKVDAMEALSEWRSKPPLVEDYPEDDNWIKGSNANGRFNNPKRTYDNPEEDLFTITGSHDSNIYLQS